MKRNVKDVHAISVPRWSLAKMRAQFNNSIATLNTIDDDVKKTDEEKGFEVLLITYLSFYVLMFFSGTYSYIRLAQVIQRRGL